MTANINSIDCLIVPEIPATQIAKNADISDPLKLGILASGSGSNFEVIAQAIQNQQLNAQVQVLIYNNPGAIAAVRAEKYRIPSILLNHRDYKKRAELDTQIVKIFQKYDVQWVIMAGWMRIVTQVLLDAFPDKVINIHPSLLPSFPGINAVEQALAAKVKITGCTVHIAHLEVDSGPILMQAAVPVFPDDTAETLHARIQVQEHKIMVGAIALISHQIAV
ncbi:MAG: phosphoribosylglycinamide formyltransferase [Oscillatoriales cyanobacterium]|uniref:Phosphoribosylglycinamide formyltransferase n=1 Tax=Microcoleus anatoxicus PTRS2 TaxID=2705321 RepID=A0ABU8YHE5_9CYAN|nr:MAG: phosphoribosylglycinamide formyltransferase [Oscillatoriales cyanobacterium]TAD98224.1 MAG: phosphoribosylglycinamide formyltransferase [Oscillatoriales cyanobacterium]TAE05688.1 MAG: phosphoribosylglycinamide formyltransferase [Oscillatoriales cyanobacterium]TAF04749.1 MAG: phosphoribosylglycinamide formyltransferase [Oscillatoriales cyanobacterium]TAF47903.1 MAG: phosphoribosylglycinamide formyltransferase [Oscillatoriales cyanobacterium]